MDSITQIVLGAAVGEVILGKRIGNKGMLLGAIAGTIPDLDVLTSLFNEDPIFRLRMHRAYSHSMFTHFLLALPLAWLSQKWIMGRETKNSPKIPLGFSRWYWFWFLGLFTHAVLDCFTTYGTRLFLPFTDYQVAFNNISVVDPLYTLPFMFILIVCLFIKRNHPKRNQIAWLSIYVSSAYMLATFGLKYIAHSKFKSTIGNHIQSDKSFELNTTPTIFNAVLWAAVATTNDSLYVAEYSFLNRSIPIKWTGYARHLELEKEFESADFKTLIWFADGNYFIQKNEDNSISIFNTKWGRSQFDETAPEKAFIFYFKAKKSNDKVVLESIQPKLDGKMFNEALRKLGERIGI